MYQLNAINNTSIIVEKLKTQKIIKKKHINITFKSDHEDTTFLGMLSYIRDTKISKYVFCGK